MAAPSGGTAGMAALQLMLLLLSFLLCLEGVAGWVSVGPNGDISLRDHTEIGYWDSTVTHKEYVCCPLCCFCLRTTAVLLPLLLLTSTTRTLQPESHRFHVCSWQHHDDQRHLAARGLHDDDQLRRYARPTLPARPGRQDRHGRQPD